MDTQHTPDMSQQQSPVNPQGKDPNRKLKKWNIIVAILDVILLLLLIFWPKQCGCNRTTVVSRGDTVTQVRVDTVLVHDTIPEERDIDRVVEEAGGESGYMGMKLVWNEDAQHRVDFDAHAKEPGGDHICYLQHNQNKNQPPTAMGGLIDVDMINPTGTGVENIVWPSKENLKDGVYRFFVHNHKNSDDNANNGFNAKIYVGNKSFIYNVTQSIPKNKEVKIADVTISNGELADIKNYITPSNLQ